VTAGAADTRVLEARPPPTAARRAFEAPPLDRAPQFAAAERHSARVRLARGAILVGALGGVAMLAAIAIFDPFGPRTASFTFGALGVEGTKITMDKPRLTGFRNDGKPYSLTAEKAMQEAKHPESVELRGVEGEIGMTDNEPMRLRADAGVFDTVGERMDLTHNVRIGNARYDARLSSASVDFKTGLYRSDQPVEVKIGADTTILADKATAINSGEQLVFEGRVRTTIRPADNATTKGAAKENNP
jgi:lipopolysaccharide export system protein LptC